MNTSREWRIQPENFAFMSCQADNSRLQRTVKHPWWRHTSVQGSRLLDDARAQRPPLDQASELDYLYGLGQVVVHPRAQAALAVALHRVCRQRHDRGCADPADSSLLMAAVASNPSISGIWQSISTRS